MNIEELYGQGRPVYSFEFFPPKTAQGVTSLFRVLDELRALEPDFVSVTYPLDRDRRHVTLEIVARVKRELEIEAMAHLTCVDASETEIRDALTELAQNHIENVLALRGDPPAEEDIVVPREQWFPHATELASYIRKNFNFSIGGAAHPEMHPESPDVESDLRYTKEKVEAGCRFLITNFFFDNRDYFDFVRQAREVGVDVPIVPGIMPVGSVPGIKRMAAMNGSKIPADFLARLEAVADDAAEVAKLGIEHAREQCRDLIQQGAPGIHFYTLNRSPATREILTWLRSQS